MKNIKVITIAILIIFFNVDMNVLASQENIENEKYDKNIKNILILNSYDVENQWEKSVLKGFNKFIHEQDEYIINVENVYLDSRNSHTNNKEYIENFKRLLESKYKESKFDLIISIDDEAFNLMRKEIFNEGSIFYKNRLLFVGTNQDIYLAEQEKEYITGFLDVRNQIEIINLIVELHKDVNPIKTINILIDNTYYNKKIVNDLQGSKYLLNSNIDINVIKGEYVDEVLEKVEDINPNNQTIIISGVYKDKISDNYINPKELVKKIKTIKDIPIYSDREDYMGSGVIGGYVDNGVENGYATGKMAMKIIKDKEVFNTPTTNEPEGIYIFDYNEIYKYSINPMNLPKQSTILNKKPYELLIPAQLKAMIIVSIVIIIALIISTIKIIGIERKKSSKNKKMYQMAKDREQLKTDFIANMSHELRTPINVITSISKLLELKANKDEIDKEYLLEKLDRINQNSSRLTRLVNNLIDITKYDSGFYECKFENINIVYVVEDIVIESADFAHQKGIGIIFDTQEEEIITSIDKEKIERAVLNLISNAIKFTNEGGKIEVIVKKEKEFVVIVIKDNGIGIEEEKLKQIFHRFYQIDSLLNRRHEGSGLGLCIVDEIIKMHDGKIEVFSEVNEGTTFRLILPIKESSEIIEHKDIQNREFKDVVKLEMSDIDK